MSNHKYVRIDVRHGDSITSLVTVFSHQLTHSVFAEGLLASTKSMFPTAETVEVVSAGLVRFGGHVCHTFGDSESLQLSSRPEDAALFVGTPYGLNVTSVP